jgi:hypothetical protein
MTKSIKSRYSNRNISSSSYGTINVSGTGGTTASTGSGYVYAPYITTSSSSVNIQPSTHTYNIFGKDVLGSSFDTLLSMMIASINLLGIEYYVELKKQGVEIHDEKVKDYLEYQLISYQRNKKIEDIIK